MTARPLFRFALGFAAALAFALPLAAAETPPPEKCAERFTELLKDFPSPGLTAYRLDGHNHDADAKAKDANFRFQGWLSLGRKTAVDALVFKKASAALHSKATFAAEARNCFTPEFGLCLRNGEQELDLLVGLHCQAVEFHAGKASARYPLSELGANAFRALFDELFTEKPATQPEKENEDKAAAKKKLTRKVSFEFKDVSVGEALKTLGSLISAAVVVDPEITEAAKKRSFSLKITELPIQEALDQVCGETGLDWEANDRHIFIGERMVMDARKAAKLVEAFKDAPLVACKVEGMEAPNEADTPEATHLARWKILVARDVLEAKTVEEVRTALTSAESYTDTSTKCFGPGMGFRLKKDGQRLDILICLECSWVYFFLGDQRLQLALSEKGKEKLKDLYEKLFPDGAPAK